MKKLIGIINLLSVIAIVYWNYYVNTGAINGNKMGQLSNEINSHFTPAGYAFSIWGIIYLGLFINAIWYLIQAFKNKYQETLAQQGIWLTVANIASGFWLWFWLNEQFLISVFCMLAILIALMIAIVRLKMEKWDAPKEIIGFVWWPICLYSGWITVATVTNIAAFLKTENFSLFFSEEIWTIIMILITTVLFLYFLYTRYMREFNAVAVWALIAIAVRHWEDIPSIATTAILCAALLLILSLIQGYKYRKGNPFVPRFMK
ncbi:MAG: tryptophan-rich sensory protein [Bacteroidota bacterium]